VDEPRALAVPASLVVGPPAEAAGGLGAVVSTARYVLDHVGVARAPGLLLRTNQAFGFDCPGCAWPDPAAADRGRLELCENGARAVADEATRFRADPAWWDAHPLDELLRWSDRDLNRAGRITAPLLLDAGADRYREASWDEAIAVVAEELRALGDPDEAVFYTSGRTSNEAAFLWQLLARVLGTNNLPDCSNLCHESSGVGLGETLGVGKGTVSLDDLHAAEVVLVVGQNPGTNHPRMLTALQEAKRRGARIVAINPLREAALVRFRHPQELSGLVGDGTALADVWLRVRVGGDVALLTGLAKSLLERDERDGGVVDRAFVDACTEGFEALAAHLRAVAWDDVVVGSGVRRTELEAVADLLARHERIVACWAMGITQHVHGVDNVHALVNLLLLRGALGKPGAGACPVRGHSNVQGDRTMGITERPRTAFLAGLVRVFGFEPPRRHGHDVARAIEAMRDGRVRVFLALGGNFLAASPDTDVTADALRRCRLTVHVSTKPNRSHLVHGRRALILPCLGRTERHVTPAGEQVVSVEDSMGIVHASRGHLPPASPLLRSEPEIVARLAEATVGDRPTIPWRALADDLTLLRARIAEVVPGFEGFEERLARPGGFVLPHPVRDERRFPTPSGRARFTVVPLPPEELREGELTMTTIRAHDQYNTTVYTDDDRYRGLRGGRKVVLVSPEDVDALGLFAGQVVTIEGREEDGRRRRVEGFVVVPYDVPRRCCATYFPEANPLVPLARRSPRSGTPASKSVPVRLIG
jgi:molybdopterin-dependent oxidoreductase alpha subunit